MRPAPEPDAELVLHGPVWTMDAAVCGPCGAEMGMLLASRVLDKESN